MKTFGNWLIGDSKDTAEDVVLFKEDLIPSHTSSRWEEMAWGGVARPPQELLPTLPQAPPHPGHCLLTRQSLELEEKNDIICHPSVDRGQTGRKSGRLPLLSSLTIILSTSNPSDLPIIIEIQGFTCITASSHNVLAESHSDTQNGPVRPLVPLSPKRCITHHKDMHFVPADP